MKITIIAHFTNSQTSRFIEVAHLFAEKGHQVTVLTSDFCHTDKAYKNVKLRYSNFNIEYLHESGYKNNVSLRRLYSHICWGKEVARYLNNNERPDVIYCALPSLTASSKAVDYCKRNNVKFAVDIQDLWPEAFSLVLNNKFAQFVFKPMEWLANKSYSYADLVIAVSDTYKNRALKVNHKDKNGLTVYLGNHLDLFDMSKHKLLKDKPSDEFWIGYTGTMGYSYDLPCAIDGIAEYLERNDGSKKIKFVAMGSGPLLNQYKGYAEEKKVDAIFTGHLNYQEMVGYMCSCDILINPIRKGASQSITNKVGDYAFSGRAVVNTQECQEYRELVETYQCGINCECGNSSDIAAAINRLITNSNICIKMGKGSRRLGEERFNRKNTYPLIINAVEKLV